MEGFALPSDIRYLRRIRQLHLHVNAIRISCKVLTLNNFIALVNRLFLPTCNGSTFCLK